MRRSVFTTVYDDQHYLPATYFPALLKRLRPPLGVEGCKKFTRGEMMRVLRLLRVPVNKDRRITYHATLAALIDNNVLDVAFNTGVP